MPFPQHIFQTILCGKSTKKKSGCRWATTLPMNSGHLLATKNERQNKKKNQKEKKSGEGNQSRRIMWIKSFCCESITMAMNSDANSLFFCFFFLFVSRVFALTLTYECFSLDADEIKKHCQIKMTFHSFVFICINSESNTNAQWNWWPLECQLSHIYFFSLVPVILLSLFYSPSTMHFALSTDGYPLLCASRGSEMVRVRFLFVSFVSKRNATVGVTHRTQPAHSLHSAVSPQRRRVPVVRPEIKS